MLTFTSLRGESPMVGKTRIALGLHDTRLAGTNTGDYVAHWTLRSDRVASARLTAGF